MQAKQIYYLEEHGVESLSQIDLSIQCFSNFVEDRELPITLLQLLNA